MFNCNCWQCQFLRLLQQLEEEDKRAEAIPQSPKKARENVAPAAPQ